MDQNRNRSLKIRMQLEGLIKKSIEEFSKANTDVLAYNTIEMAKVNPSTMVHCLNVKEDYKLIN